MKISTLTILCAAALAGTVTGAEPAKKPADPQAKTLTYASIVSFFKEAKLRPIQVQKRCTVFFEGEFKNANAYNYCLIIVENSDEDVQVTFYLTDAHEMNWVTEFLDAPFFAQTETKRLFDLMNSHGSARGREVGRYRVDFNRWEPRHAQILVFSFVRR